MTDRLKGKHALITAAAAGIGRAIAMAFVREGAQVLATDIDEDGLESLASEHDLRVATLDVTSGKQVAEMLLQQPVTTLVNCVGWVPGGTLMECDDAQMARAFDVNVASMLRVTRRVLPAMIAAGSGSIINMASVASSIKGVPNRCAYGTTKAAVLGLTKSIAADFVESGIRCNAICPGTIDTPSLSQRIALADDPLAARTAFLARQPTGRFGTADEVAALAVYLASDESAFTTGALHVIDGGWSN